MLVLGTEPGSGSPSAAASSVGAAVVCRHRTIINSTGKGFVFYVHTSSLSQPQTRLRVFPERVVKALILWFVSTSNSTQKRNLFFLKNREVPHLIVDGKPLDRP